MDDTFSYRAAPLPLRRRIDPRKVKRAVVAFVVAADSAASPPVDELDRTCLEHIARFKRPKEYRFVDVLPTNNYGKVVKRELRDQL